MWASIRQNRIGGYVSAILGIAAVTAVCVGFRGQLNDTTVALALLLVVVFVATVWGSWPALTASVLGILCFDYFFLLPEPSFAFISPQNLIDTVAFVLTAVTIGQLSAQAQRRLQELEARRTEARSVSAYNRSLIEASLDPLVTIGPDGRITDVNAATEAATGRSRAQLIGTDFSDYFAEPEKARAGYKQAFREGFVRDYALELRHRDGRVTPVLYNASVYRDESGNVVGVFAAARDITERKRAEKALRESEARLRSLIEASLDPLVTIGPDGRITDVNAATEAATGRSRAQLIGTDFSDYFAEPEKARAGYEQAFREGFVRDYALELRHRDGRVTPVLYNASVYRDESGNVVGVFAAARDITERKRREDEIRLLARLQAEVAELGQHALSAIPAFDLLDEAVAQVTRTLDLDCCMVWELLPSRDAFLLRSGVGWEPEHVGQATIGVGADSQAGYTLLCAKPVVVEDLRTEERFRAPELIREHRVVSGMSVVISTSEGPYGILEAHTRHRRAFTRDEVNFLQAIANVLGLAIERQRGEAQLQRINRAYRALSRCNQALIRATDESTLLQQTCETVVKEAGYRLCWVGQAENDEAKSVRPVAQAGFEEGYLDTLNITWADTERGQGPTGTCIRTRQPARVKDIATDPRMIPWRAEALKRGYASSIAVPLLVDSAVFGAIHMYASQPDAFDAEEVKLLTELADDLAFGIMALRTRAERARAEEELCTLNAELEQRVTARTAELQAANKLKDELILREHAAAAELAEAHEREITIGFKIQQSLLLEPPPRDLPEVRIAALTIPSQRIDGDFYYFFRHEDQSLDIIVGDVMGKGVPAALLGAAIKSQFIRALSQLLARPNQDRLPEPREIVMLAHAELTRRLISLDSFVTLCYARLDLARRRVDLVDCGHNMTMHYRPRTGVCAMLRGDNLPLGFSEREIYEQMTVAFEPGDVLLFYSDGLIDARNSAGEPFGVDRLAECVRMRHQLDPEELIDQIQSEVINFARSATFADDLSCVVVKFAEREAPVAPIAHAETQITSDLKELAQARAFVRRFCEGGLDPPPDKESIGQLELAVNEAVSNIAKHAYGGRTDQLIQMDADAFADRIVIQLHHQGVSFNPETVEPPAFNGSRESGFGLYLIAHTVDEVRYSHDEDGYNHIYLVKYQRPADRGTS